MKTLLLLTAVTISLTACKKSRSCSCEVNESSTTKIYPLNGSPSKQSTSSNTYTTVVEIENARKKQIRAETLCMSRLETNSYTYTLQISSSDSTQEYARNSTQISTDYKCEIK